MLDTRCWILDGLSSFVLPLMVLPFLLLPRLSESLGTLFLVCPNPWGSFFAGCSELDARYRSGRFSCDGGCGFKAYKNESGNKSPHSKGGFPV
jgi:hypothetical protein